MKYHIPGHLQVRPVNEVGKLLNQLLQDIDERLTKLEQVNEISTEILQRTGSGPPEMVD